MDDARRVVGILYLLALPPIHFVTLTPVLQTQEVWASLSHIMGGLYFSEELLGRNPVVPSMLTALKGKVNAAWLGALILADGVVTLVHLTEGGCTTEQEFELGCTIASLLSGLLS